MRRLADRRLLTDLATTLLVAVLVALGGSWSQDAAGLVLAGAQLAPLPLRRRFPGWVLAAVAAATVAHLVTTAPRNLDYLPVLLALYTAPMSPRRLVRYGLCAAATAAVGAAMVPAKGFVDGAALTTAICVVAWLLGVERQRHVAERAELTRHRLERLAADRRDRTARRLHDTLARTTTVMLVQAEALLAVGDLTAADRRRVDAMLAAGRDALGQVRATLRELHGDDEPAGEPALAEVLAQLRTAGLVLDRVPDDAAVPDPVRPLAGRVIAEAATNALRHHGPGTRLGVDIAVANGEVRIAVASRARDLPGPAAPGSGYGLTSLRAQLAERGGSLTAGPVDSGWSVVAVIPCPATPVAATP
ncbi:sensor histidine kinase [Amycolatopsis sp. FDAARGOS 1241]|uniref:sensor histidine kinase n=1 Tax=Amycolatopsis sp. FDAARGOS 1241 TaxID=2778070 RepID=UPI0019504415|nr:histidine kinase [Amycolatopsis sp. FDAARGOS 1241]QRP43377.1 histidine kinase [Amycolatopsis sp. FDAARGOS 1241]